MSCLKQHGIVEPGLSGCYQASTWHQKTRQQEANTTEFYYKRLIVKLRGLKLKQHFY